MAVIGVIPTLYNTASTLVIRHKVKQTIERHGLAEYKIRSDTVNRVIEVVIPKYQIIPYDRANRTDLRYWRSSSRPISLPGASVRNVSNFKSGVELRYHHSYPENIGLGVIIADL
jgi:hypothetical protein